MSATQSAAPSEAPSTDAMTSEPAATESADTAAEPTETETPEPATETASAPGEVSTGGTYTATLDGEPFVVENATVACVGSGDEASIVVSAGGNPTQGKSIVLTVSGGKVTALAIGASTEGTVAYAEGAGMGSVELSMEGKTYTVKGEGPYVDMANPTAVKNKKFDVTVTCG